MVDPFNLHKTGLKDRFLDSMKEGYPRIQLKKGREASLRRRHPWVFSGAIEKVEGETSGGAIAELFSAEGKYLATGFYSKESIAVKVLSFERRSIDFSFWFDRLSAAHALRTELGLVQNSGTNAYRLVHGEGDSLPGLIIDIYNNVAVLQPHSEGMVHNRTEIGNALREVIPSIRAIYCKSPGDEAGEYLYSRDIDTLILENGLRFRVDWEQGQKTGFYLDQRENRAYLRELVRGKRVLNAFAYTGGFSVYAFAGEAAAVTSVETSKTALERLDENLALNFDSVKHESVCEDCFEYLNSIENKFDIIVLDPPAFAKHQKALPRAERGYRTINALALKQIARGGILFTFSCSQLLDRGSFHRLVFEAACDAERPVRVLRELRQAPCHPVSIFHAEGEYLKGLVLKVDEHD